MNEVTQIHLGRQQFTIAADAHTALRSYLSAIKKQAGSGVADEVELRMAELLTERGVGGDKVILHADIDFLKSQLGEPTDFTEDDAGTAPVGGLSQSKRLFRDTQNGMIAGVAAGLAGYFGVDILLVRILFVVTVLAGGWGILLYIALWLLVPEAKTPSERLQLQGKAVNIDSLKEVIERADVPGAAQRLSNRIGPVINSMFRTILKIIGAGVLLVALAMLFSVIAGGLYVGLHHGQIIAENYFPVGSTEHLALFVGLSWLALVSLLMIVVGMAMVRRKWPAAPWATGVLLGLIFIGLAASLALAADIAPRVHDRIDAAHHSMVRIIKPFSTLNIKGDVPVDIEPSSSYEVVMRYVGSPSLATIKTSVSGHTLTVDSSQFRERTDCPVICLFPAYNLRIVVYTPQTPVVPNPVIPYDGAFAPTEPHVSIHIH